MKHAFGSFTVDIENDECVCPRKVVLNVKLNNWIPGTKVEYVAAQSPDYNQGFTGSALPFTDSEMAFDQTPNYGIIKPKKASFALKLNYPNSYYSHLGTRLIPPYVRITIDNKFGKVTEFVELGEIAPFRTLSWQNEPVGRFEPSFYDRSHLKKGRSQEAILRASGYRMETPPNFWGGAVPHP